VAGRNCRGCPDVCGYVCGRCASTASGGLGATIGAPRAGALGAAGEPSLHLVWGFAPLLGAEGSEVGCFTPTAGANPRAGCIPHPQSGDSAPTRGANHRQGCMPANPRRVTPRPSPAIAERRGSERLRNWHDAGGGRRLSRPLPQPPAANARRRASRPGRDAYSSPSRPRTAAVKSAAATAAAAVAVHAAVQPSQPISRPSSSGPSTRPADTPV